MQSIDPTWSRWTRYNLVVSKNSLSWKTDSRMGVFLQILSEMSKYLSMRLQAMISLPMLIFPLEPTKLLTSSGCQGYCSPCKCLRRLNNPSGTAKNITIARTLVVHPIKQYNDATIFEVNGMCSLHADIAVRCEITQLTKLKADDMTSHQMVSFLNNVAKLSLVAVWVYASPKRMNCPASW